MTDPRNQRIEAAISFAHLFIREARRALDGLPNQLPRAAAQLYLAVEQIDGKAIDRHELTEVVQ
jgi:hypothetical protein